MKVKDKAILALRLSDLAPVACVGSLIVQISKY